MEKYFYMRLLDYTIQTQTRVCTHKALKLGNIDELMDRNIMLESHVRELNKLLGIPLAKPPPFHHQDAV